MAVFAPAAIGVVGLDSQSAVPIPGNIVSTDVRVALFGDSTAAVVASQSPASQDGTVLTAPFSGAITLTTIGDKFLLQTQYPRAYLVFLGGVSGETSADMLARDQAAASNTRRAIIDLLNFKPDVIIFRGGSINDLIAGTASSTVYANHILLLQRMLEGGAVIIDEGIAGYSGGGLTQASIRQNLASLNIQWANYAQNYPGRIYFLDPVGVTCNADGSMLDNSFDSNGYHLNMYSAYRLAQAEAALMTQIFGPSINPKFPGKNIFTNPMFANTATTGIGTLATGVTTTASNATRQNGKIENINGKSFQTMEYLITASAANGSMACVFDPTASTFNIQPGDIYGFEFDFLFSGPTNTSPIPAPTDFQARMQVRDSGASNTITIDQLTPPGTQLAAPYNVWPTAFTGKAVFGPFLFQLGSSALNATTTFQIKLQTNANDGSVFKLGMSNPRWVKLSSGFQNLGNTINTVSNASGQTITATQIAQGNYIATTRGAAQTDTTDTAANIYSAIQTLTGYQAGQMLTTNFRFRYINGSANAVTIAGGANVTPTGTGATAVAAGTWQEYVIAFTSTTAATMTSIGKGTYA